MTNHPPIPPGYRLATDAEKQTLPKPQGTKIILLDGTGWISASIDGAWIHALYIVPDLAPKAEAAKPQPAFGPGSDDLFNWPEIPKEATHARILQSGGAMWYNFDPDGPVDLGDKSGTIAVGNYTIPPNLDWRTSKRRRPQAVEKSQEERDDYAMKVSWSMLDCTVSVEMAFLTAWKDALRHARSSRNGGGK